MKINKEMLQKMIKEAIEMANIITPEPKHTDTISKSKLIAIIEEELEAVMESPFGGDSTTMIQKDDPDKEEKERLRKSPFGGNQETMVNKDAPNDSNPLGGNQGTLIQKDDPGKAMQKKAAAFDKVEAALKSILKQIQSAGL